MNIDQEEYHKKTMEYMFKNDPFFTTGLFLNELPPPFIGEEEMPLDLCGERSCFIRSEFGISSEESIDSMENWDQRVGPTWVLLRRANFFSILKGVTTDDTTVKEGEFFAKMSNDKDNSILIMSPDSFCYRQKISPDLFSYDEKNGFQRIPYFNEVRVLVIDNPFSPILLKKRSFLYSEKMTEHPLVIGRGHGRETLNFNREYIMHPVGHTYGGPKNPLNEDLADQGNWYRLSKESNFVVMEESYKYDYKSNRIKPRSRG